VVAVGQQSLPPLDRLGLIDDLFALAQAGHASSVQVLKLLEAFVNEEEYTVWEKICNVLGSLSQLVLDQPELHGQIKSFSRRLMGGIAGRLAWESKSGEDHSTKMLRSLILGQMAALDHPDVLVEAERRFDALVNHGQTIESDLRLPVYKAILRSSNSVARFESLKRIYCEATLQEEKVRVANALGSLKDESLLMSALDFAVSHEVLAQHTLNIVSSVALGSSAGRRLAWDFFRQRWAEFSERFQGAFLLARTVKTITKNFTTEQKALEVDTFFKVHLLDQFIDT
jgi:puromycin-sensitive aminopeptidase